MIRPRAQATALIAVLVVVGLLSMHALDSHTPAGAHRAAPAAHGHDAPPRPSEHRVHLHAVAPGRPSAVAERRPADAAPVGTAGTATHPHTEHLGLCALVVLTALGAAVVALRSIRCAPPAPLQLVGTSWRPDPPVPRLGLVLS